MPENPPETPNYGFPIMSEADDDYVDVWHLIMEDGGPTDNDGFIVPLDSILDGIESDVSTNSSDISSVETAQSDHESSTSVHGSNGDVAGKNDLYTDSEASDAAPVQSVNGETGDVEVGAPDETEEYSGVYRWIPDHSNSWTSTGTFDGTDPQWADMDFTLPEARWISGISYEFTTAAHNDWTSDGWFRLSIDGVEEVYVEFNEYHTNQDEITVAEGVIETEEIFTDDIRVEADVEWTFGGDGQTTENSITFYLHEEEKIYSSAHSHGIE